MDIIRDITSFKLSNEAFETILKATLLLVLSVSGNFLAETLGCQSQKVLGNMVVKHILILFMIYFTIDFTQRDQDVINPFINVFKAFCVWILFHLFTHMNILPTFIVGLLLMILFFISNYRHYIEEKKKIVREEKQALEKLDKSLKLSQEILLILVLVVILIGCVVYFLEKKREYGNAFRAWKFIFGVKKCKGYTPKAAKLW